MVSREGLFAILQKLGCPPTLLGLVKSLHEDMSATVFFEGSTSDSFAVRSGVKQGCVLAPTLFGIFFSVLLHHAFNDHVDEDGVFLHTRSDGKLFNLARLRAKSKVQKVLVRELLFADDAALVSHSAAGLHRLMDRFSAACSEFALVISIKKTVVYAPSGKRSVAGNSERACAGDCRQVYIYWLNHQQRPVTGQGDHNSHRQSRYILQSFAFKSLEQ